MSHLEASRIELAEQGVRTHQEDAVDKLRCAVSQVSPQDYQAVLQQVVDHDKKANHIPLVELDHSGVLSAKPIGDLLLPEKDLRAVAELANCLQKEDYNGFGQVMSRFKDTPQHFKDLMKPLHTQMERDNTEFKYVFAASVVQKTGFTMSIGTLDKPNAVKWHEVSTTGARRDYEISTKF